VDERGVGGQISRKAYLRLGLGYLFREIEGRYREIERHGNKKT
jgi:hypothetical protein